jgi:hypoxanthine phosphoribosyltransferase
VIDFAFSGHGRPAPEATIPTRTSKKSAKRRTAAPTSAPAAVKRTAKAARKAARPGRDAAKPVAAKRGTAKRAAATSAAVQRAGKPAAAKRAAARDRRPRSTPREQPLGVGVADAFALERLRGAPVPQEEAPGGVREIGWAEFGDLARELANRIAADFTPDVVLAIANAGVYVGGAIAPVLGAELVHLHLPGRGRAERLPRLNGKKVLVVDDAANSGKTLDVAVTAARSARAAEVRSAVIALRPGGAHPDWSALETRDVVVFGWDYQFHAGGTDGDPGDTGV